MQILMILIAVLLVWLIVWFYRPETPEQQPTATEALPDADSDARERRELGKVLTDALAFFNSAREETRESEATLLASIDSLMARCVGLLQRIENDEGSARSLRQPVLRLLLPLNGVVSRAAKASHRTENAERDSVLTASADAIRRAAEQLGQITERADEVALRQLEIDLEVLETRLGSADV